MQKLLALTILIIFAVTVPAYSDEYLLTVSLEEFARPSMKPVELAKLLANPKELLKVLKPRKKVFRQTFKLSTDAPFLQEVELGDVSIKTEGRLQPKVDNNFTLTVSTQYVKRVMTPKGMPINSISSYSGTYNCKLGKKQIVGQARSVGSVEVTALTFQLDPIKKQK